MLWRKIGVKSVDIFNEMPYAEIGLCNDRITRISILMTNGLKEVVSTPLPLVSGDLYFVKE